MFYWHCSQAVQPYLKHIRMPRFACMPSCPFAWQPYITCISKNELVFVIDSGLSYFSFADIFSDLCTAALSDSDDNEASTWGDVSQDSR